MTSKKTIVFLAPASSVSPMMFEVLSWKRRISLWGSRSAMIAGAILVSSLIACGGAGKKTGPGVELVDCNYFWPKQSVHVCIKDMPKKECEDLFTVPYFDREKDCVCSQPGRKAEQVKGMGYIQYNCK